MVWWPVQGVLCPHAHTAGIGFPRHPEKDQAVEDEQPLSDGQNKTKDKITKQHHRH